MSGTMWRHGLDGAGAATAEDVERVVFSATELREGRDPDDVDNFLDKVALPLEGLVQDVVSVRKPEHHT